jgi:hypothetical protein
MLYVGLDVHRRRKDGPRAVSTGTSPTIRNVSPRWCAGRSRVRSLARRLAPRSARARCGGPKMRRAVSVSKRPA